MSELQLQSGTPVFCGWIAGAPRNDPLRIKLCGNGVNWTEGQVWRLTGGTGWPQKRLSPDLRTGDLDACERAVISVMQSLPHSPFHITIDIGISNDPFEAVQHFDGFFHSEAQRSTLMSVFEALK